MEIEVQENGQIVIPEILLTELGIKPGDIVDISEVDGEIFIRPVKSSDPSIRRLREVDFS